MPICRASSCLRWWLTMNPDTTASGSAVVRVAAFRSRAGRDALSFVCFGKRVGGSACRRAVILRHPIASFVHRVPPLTTMDGFPSWVGVITQDLIASFVRSLRVGRVALRKGRDACEPWFLPKLARPFRRLGIFSDRIAATMRRAVCVSTSISLLPLPLETNNGRWS